MTAERTGTTARRAGLEMARQVLQTEARALEKLAEGLDEEALGRALDVLLACDTRVVCSGMGKSGIIARKLAATLASTGSPAFFLHPAEAGHGDLGMLVDGDVFIALSHSGDTGEIVALLPAIRRLNVRLIAMVGDPDSIIAREADVVLCIDVDAEACPLGLAPTASTTAALALGDALAMALLKERGFGVDEFARFHPKGSLGRRLLRVRTVMHTGDQVPRVGETASFAVAIEEMTAKGLGMTLVESADGRVVGIITDGDVRRIVQSGIDTDSSARDCMTPNPVLIDADALAAEALRVLEESRITVLVVDGGDRRAVGVVHLHDLWRTQMV